MFLKEEDKICHNRHLHPSIYRKIVKTKDLIQKGIDTKDLREKGGLDLKTYKALKERWKDQKQFMENSKQKVLTKYGSLNAAPLSVGPCRKIKPVVGTKNAVVLLTEFNDVKHSYNPSDFEELLFKKGSNKSMRDYYLEASWKQLDITGKVNNRWFSAAGDIADYVDEVPVKGHYPRAQKLVKETIMQAKKGGTINFKPFAKNGEIEILIIIYAGKGMDTKLNIKYIRPHQDRLSEPIEVQKGIWANRYCLIPELPLDDLGCFCHEVGHLLGLPDLYKEGYSPVVGSWCLMAAGDHINDGSTPSHPSAWCKIKLGWKEPILIKKIPAIQDIPAVIDDNGIIYKLEVEGSNGGEYFLLENRQQKGFDQNLPGSGLLIWHVDENKCVHYAPNSDPKHFFLTLVQSDGKNELQSDMMVLIEQEGETTAIKDIMGDEGDVYPGITLNRNFDEKSNPNSDSNLGAKSRVSVTSISDPDDNMKAQIGIKHQSNITTTQPTENDLLKTYKIIIKNFIAFMNSQKDVTPYDEGYEAGKQDIIASLIEDEGLNSYQKGYQRGYRHGYKKSQDKLKK